MSVKRILVTGAAGFIGKNLSLTLAKHKYRILGIDLCKEESLKFPIVQSDILELEKLSKIIDDFSPDWIIHLAEKRASPYNTTQTFSLLKNNISSLINLFSCLKHKNIRFIYFSSGEIYGKSRVPYKESDVVKPTSEYGLSKFFCEKLCQHYYYSQKKPVIIIRPSVAYGPGQYSGMLIPTIISKALAREKLDLTEGKQTRDFIYVNDLADAIARIVSKDLSGFYIFNLGSSYEISVRQITDKIIKLMDNPVHPNYGALPYRESEVWRYYLDIGRANKILGWLPKFSLDEGLRRTICWQKSKLK